MFSANSFSLIVFGYNPICKKLNIIDFCIFLFYHILWIRPIQCDCFALKSFNIYANTHGNCSIARNRSSLNTFVLTNGSDVYLKANSRTSKTETPDVKCRHFIYCWVAYTINHLEFTHLFREYRIIVVD